MYMPLLSCVESLRQRYSAMPSQVLKPEPQWEIMMVYGNVPSSATRGCGVSTTVYVRVSFSSTTSSVSRPCVLKRSSSDSLAAVMLMETSWVGARSCKSSTEEAISGLEWKRARHTLSCSTLLSDASDMPI